MTEMIEIDGSMGEGGGQIVRSSLSLSLVTGRPLTIERIRAARAKPGLRRQHLTAVRAAAEVGRAAVEGAEVGSSRIVIRPQAIQAGDYHFSIGTAGSTTLVLQTVLPALMTAAGSTQLLLEGGTHNPLAPPFDFFEQTYIPLINKIGPQIEARLERHGFFPAGGGRLAVSVAPAEALTGLELLKRGKSVERRARVLLANLPEHVARREAETVIRKLGLPKRSVEVELIENAAGPGNVVLIELHYEQLTEVIVAYGQKGVKAERVAAQACQAATRYIESGAVVGQHLADQLLLPLSLAAHHSGQTSRFHTAAISSHTTTNIAVIHAVLASGD